MAYRKFSGPIEEIIGRTCPGPSYCTIDRCFRDGKTCGNDSSCCLDRNAANDIVTALGCGSGNFTSGNSKNKFSTLGENPGALQTCQKELNLTDSDKEFLCLNISPDECFQRMCDLGCTSNVCPRPHRSEINLKNQVCQTVQQYCDVLDPSLLTDPNYDKLCCQMDPIAGVLNRTVCGCPGNPCNTNPVTLQNVQKLKNMAFQYWEANPTPTYPVTNPTVDPEGYDEGSTGVINVTPPLPRDSPYSPQSPHSPDSPKESSEKNIYIYVAVILSIILILGLLYWFFIYKRKVDVTTIYNSPFSTGLDSPDLRRMGSRRELRTRDDDFYSSSEPSFDYWGSEESRAF